MRSTLPGARPVLARLAPRSAPPLPPYPVGLLDRTTRLVTRRFGALPARRVPDPDRGRHGARLLDDASMDDGCGAGGLEAHHAREGFDLAGLTVFGVPAPIRRDVARVTDGQ